MGVKHHMNLKYIQSTSNYKHIIHQHQPFNINQSPSTSIVERTLSLPNRPCAIASCTPWAQVSAGETPSSNSSLKTPTMMVLTTFWKSSRPILKNNPVFEFVDKLNHYYSTMVFCKKLICLMDLDPRQKLFW